MQKVGTNQQLVADVMIEVGKRYLGEHGLQGVLFLNGRALDIVCMRCSRRWQVVSERMCSRDREATISGLDALLRCEVCDAG